MKIRVAFCMLVLLSPLFSFADNPGRIQGQVTKAGKAIPGVDVILQELSLSTMTDKNGVYSFHKIPAGEYTLIFSQGGNSLTKDGVIVTAGATTPLDVEAEWEVQLTHAITVYGASRRTERVVDAPAAVSVVEEAEIERQAAHGQLPKILETVQGVDSVQSGLSDFNLTMRGFNSGFNRRVLTLIDSIDMSYVLLGQQVWATNSAFLSDLASMEVIRGPGSALYGANAYSGVLNISTKDPQYSPGGVVRFSLGEMNMGRFDLRYAGKLGKDWHFKVMGNYMVSEDFTQSRNESVEYEGLPMEAVPLSLDKYKTMHGKIRLDKHFKNGDVITFEVLTMGMEGPTYIASGGRLQTIDYFAPLARVNFKSEHWNILAYGCRMDFQGITLGSGWKLYSDLYRLHGEVQGFTDFADGKGRIVGGFSLRMEGVDTANPQGIQTSMAEARDDHMEGVFAQLDYSLTDKLKLVFAGRMDTSTLHETHISPKACVVYTFNPGHSLRLSFNRAFQVPDYLGYFLWYPVGPPVDLSAIENGISAAFGGMDLGLGFENIPILGLGNENLKVEEIMSYEVGYSNVFGRKIMFNLSYYRSLHKNFVTDLLPFVNPAYGPYTPPSNLSPLIQNTILATLEQNLPPGLLAIMSNDLRDSSPIFAAVSHTNIGKVNTQGIEVGLKYFFSQHWTADLNYAWFDFTVKEELTENPILVNTPEHRFNLGAAYASNLLDVSIQYRWVDDFPWHEGFFNGVVKSYSTIDLAANIYFRNGFSLGVNVSNLLDKKHYQVFGGDILRRNAVATVSYRW